MPCRGLGTASAVITVPLFFAAQQSILAGMLETMAGLRGDRDALTRFVRPLTGAYHVVPSANRLATFDG